MQNFPFHSPSLIDNQMKMIGKNIVFDIIIEQHHYDFSHLLKLFSTIRSWNKIWSLSKINIWQKEFKSAQSCFLLKVTQALRQLEIKRQNCWRILLLGFLLYCNRILTVNEFKNNHNCHKYFQQTTPLQISSPSYLSVGWSLYSRMSPQ